MPAGGGQGILTEEWSEERDARVLSTILLCIATTVAFQGLSASGWVLSTLVFRDVLGAGDGGNFSAE